MQNGIDFYQKKLFSKAQECFVSELKHLSNESEKYQEVLRILEHNSGKSGTAIIPPIWATTRLPAMA